MKKISSNAIRAQLAQRQTAAPGPDLSHPDADTLAAFSEGALLDHERAELFEHLATCPDCRAILHAATTAIDSSIEILPAETLHRGPIPEFAPVAQSAPAPALPSAAPQDDRPQRPPIRSWLPGFALVACLLVMAASTVLFYRALHTGPTPPPTVARQPAPPPPGTVARLDSQPEIAAAPGAKMRSAPALAAKKLQPSRHAITTAEAPARPMEPRIGAAVPAPVPATSGISSSGSFGDLSAQQAQNAPAVEQAPLHAQMQTQMVVQPNAAATAKPAPRSTQPASATETVKVEPRLALRRLHTTDSAAGFIPAVAVQPRFRITGSGHLERSIQASIWMPVSIDSGVRFRVVSLFGSDIWAGGDHLRLFHSVDNGVTWTEVQLPASADHSHAITHIRIDNPQKITIEDDTGMSWTTSNTGASWQSTPANK